MVYGRLLLRLKPAWVEIKILRSTSTFTPSTFNVNLNAIDAQASTVIPYKKVRYGPSKGEIYLKPGITRMPVSYTHLTLPTILLV